MSVVNEQDLELLETYLDGELSPAEEDQLSARLERDALLVQALGALRREREMRQSFFAGLEPAENDPDVRNLLSEVSKQTTRDVLWGERLKKMRWVSGVAACLLVGFLGGYGLRGPSSAAPGNTAGFGPVGSGSLTATPVVSNQPTAGNQGGINFPGISVSDWNRLHNNANANNVGFEVRLTDQAGNVVGVQRFRTLEEAQEFVNDVTRLQSQHQQLRSGGGRLVADQF
jgi:hypothetical protein